MLRLSLCLPTENYIDNGSILSIMLKVKCSICGYDKHMGSLHIHHKDHNHLNNDENNLDVLCANCHMEYHHNNADKRLRYPNKEPHYAFSKKTMPLEIEKLESEIIDLIDESKCYKSLYFKQMEKCEVYQKWTLLSLDKSALDIMYGEIKEIEVKK